jgi:ribosomal protein S18 acetylase RimI-like enzyme
MSIMKFELHTAQITHIGRMMELYEEARRWHAEMSVSQWPLFELERVLDDIDNKRLFVIKAGQCVLGGVTVTDEDVLIWGDDLPALYIHRLVVARDFKGQNIGSMIVEHVERMAIKRRKLILRLDCWADNDRLKRYYEQLGFKQVRDVAMGAATSLPAHYRNSTTTLFERPCGAGVGSALGFTIGESTYHPREGSKTCVSR